MKLLVKLFKNGTDLCTHTVTSKRVLSGSAALCSRYDPKVFREPIVDLEQVIFMSFACSQRLYVTYAICNHQSHGDYMTTSSTIYQ